MKIEYIPDEKINREQGARCYTVKVNDEILLECLAEDDLDALSIGEIKRLIGEVRE